MTDSKRVAILVVLVVVLFAGLAVGTVAADDGEIELNQILAFQGERVEYEITNGDDGDRFFAAIEVDEARNEFNPDERVFRAFEDTRDRGAVDEDGNQVPADDPAAEYFFAELEIDGTTAVGQIDTQFLDDTSVDVELYRTQGNIGDAQAEIDDDTLDVLESEITIDSPPRTYVPGMEVNLNGTVSEGLRDVGVFVRDRDDYFHVTNISVDSQDNTYEEGNLLLSSSIDLPNDNARTILSQPGVYRYGVIDLLDVTKLPDDPESDSPNPFGEDGDTPSGGLNQSDFSSGASTQKSLQVATPSLEAEFVTYDGDIFQDDKLQFTGTLLGPRTFVTIFTDSRGGSDAFIDTADRGDGAIDESYDVSDRRTGQVQATVLSPGRDGTFGDGTFNVTDEVADRIAKENPGSDFTGDTTVPATPRNLVEIIEDGYTDMTQSQVRETLLDNTVDEPGSDDLIVSESFRLMSDPITDIDDILPAHLDEEKSGVHPVERGDTMLVRGTTNRNPDDATIVVEAVDGHDLLEINVAVTEDWDTAGIWSVEIEITEDVEPGQYLIQSDDGDSIDEVNVEIVDSVDDPDEGVHQSPVEGVSDKLWTEVTGDGDLSLGELGTAIQGYQDNEQVNGVEISLVDLGSLIQYYQTE